MIVGGRCVDRVAVVGSAVAIRHWGRHAWALRPRSPLHVSVSVQTLWSRHGLRQTSALTSSGFAWVQIKPSAQSPPMIPSSSQSSPFLLLLQATALARPTTNAKVQSRVHMVGSPSIPKRSVWDGYSTPLAPSQDPVVFSSWRRARAPERVVRARNVLGLDRSAGRPALPPAAPVSQRFVDVLRSHAAVDACLSPLNRQDNARLCETRRSAGNPRSRRAESGAGGQPEYRRSRREIGANHVTAKVAV